MARHELLGGRVYLFKRSDNARYWQCAAFLNGYNHRESTRLESLAQAKDFAEDWYLELRGKLRAAELSGDGPAKDATTSKPKKSNEKTFRFAAEEFLREYKVLTAGQRSPIYVGAHRTRLDNHILPFMGDKRLSEITPGLLQQYRMHRHEKAMATWGKPPARNTIHQEGW